jgi:hypothetical protein
MRIAYIITAHQYPAQLARAARPAPRRGRLGLRHQPDGAGPPPSSRAAGSRSSWNGGPGRSFDESFPLPFEEWHEGGLGRRRVGRGSPPPLRASPRWETAGVQRASASWWRSSFVWWSKGSAGGGYSSRSGSASRASSRRSTWRSSFYCCYSGSGPWPSGLPKVGASDPPTFGGAAPLFLLVATCASIIPARRATQIDPMVALRDA